MVPLALAATGRGDDVLVATGITLSDWVTTCGFQCAEVADYGSPTPAQLAGLARFGEKAAFHFFPTLFAPPMVRALIELCRSWHPDVIIHEECEYAASLVGEHLGIPCVTHSFAAPAKPQEERTATVSALEPIWAAYTTAGARLSGETYLDACPPPFQTDAVSSIPGVRQIRPVSFDGPSGEPPAWLMNIRRPAAYVTFGTVPHNAQVVVIQEVMDAVAKRVASVVVTSGPNPVDAFSVPDNVVIATYVRQSALLGSVDLVVSHGGAGTTLGAIEHGLPHVVVPQRAFSGLRNAERVEALGIGLHVPADSGPELLEEAVLRTLDDPTFARQATALRKSLDTLPAPERVLDDLHKQLT
jgi:UDP:flavonoid glycosyltransferase YjiC (YdhE family)